jgi:FixJ family two-component response regulator
VGMPEARYCAERVSKCFLERYKEKFFDQRTRQCTTTRFNPSPSGSWLPARPLNELTVILTTVRRATMISADAFECGSRLSPATTPIVFIVDDDLSVRESLESLVLSVGWQAETFASAEDFLDRPRVVAPSCLVLDVQLPDLSGLDLQKRVVDRVDMPLIFITGYGDVPTTVQAMKAGALEFLTKPYRGEVVLAAIENAITRSRAALARQAKVMSIRDHYASLSRREREVMALVVSGRLNKQVGGELGISEITVKAHRAQVMRKMRAESLADLVRIATRLETIPIGESSESYHQFLFSSPDYP